MAMQFTITTNKDTAEKIRRQFEWDEKFNSRRSIVLAGIVHHQPEAKFTGYSVVTVKARSGVSVEPSDIFWLGHFSANQ